jgi:hypothetical protein
MFLLYVFQIVHMCLELTTNINNEENNKQSLSKVRFWTEQLKQLHLIRYGPLNNDLDIVKRVMKHTQTVLRQPDGIDKVQYNYI